MDERCFIGSYCWVSGGCLKGAWNVSEMFLEGDWKVSGSLLGRCLEGPDWTCLASFGPGKYLVVSEFCLDCVWRVSG